MRNNKLKRVKSSTSTLQKAINKRILAKAVRQWVETTPKIHALNYLYYRYFTNEFELFLINRSEEE